MEEAISSSQMEGASTTRKLAKDMLMKRAVAQVALRTNDIQYNYRTIRVYRRQ